MNFAGVKNTWCLIVLIFSNQLHAQHARISDYYQNINSAELSITDYKFEDARTFYKKAFALKYPNGKDLYNAFLSAYYLKDSSLAKGYFNELAVKGFKRPFFKDTLTDASFYQYIAAGYDSCYRIGARSKMAYYGAILNEIAVADEEPRRSNRYPLDSTQRAQMHAVDSLNVQRLKNYILQFGFPSFEQKGFGDDTAPNHPGTLWMVCWHAGSGRSSIDSMLLKAVHDGDFAPVDWATIVSAGANATADDYHMQFWKDADQISTGQLAEINRMRASIYLEPYDDYKKKWYFAQKLQEKAITTYNPNIYPENTSTIHQFCLLNYFLIYSKI